MASYSNNQMQFNLNVPVRPHNMAVRFQKPDPIIIEKSPVLPVSGSVTSLNSPAFTFSSVSEEKLALAVQLARRDMKQKNFEEEMQRINSQKKGKLKMQTGKTKIIKSKEYEERLSRPQVKSKDLPIRVKDKVISKHGTVHSRSQSPGKARRAKPQKTKRNPEDESLLTERPLSNCGVNTSYKTNEDKNTAEVKRLRKELYKFLQQIKHARLMAKNGTLGLLSVPKGVKKDEGLLSDEENEARKAVRAEELAVRTCRLLYTSQQQVREIQEDMNKHGYSAVNSNKKNQLLAKLASVHRSVVRNMQNYMKNICDQDGETSMARVQKDLTSLVRQLSLCCTQLDIAGDSSIPESVLELLKDAAEMNEELDKQQHSSPPTPKMRKTHEKTAAKAKNIGSKRTEEKTHLRPSRVVIEKTFPAKFGENKENSSRAGNLQCHQAPQTIDRLKASSVKGTGASPDRENVLRAGISALMKAAEQSPQASLYHRPDQSQLQDHKVELTHPLAWDISWNESIDESRHGDKSGVKKSLLLPSKLKKSSRGRAVQRDVHFADPTVSSMLKAVAPHGNLLDDSTASLQKSPRSTSVPSQGSPSAAKSRRARSASPANGRFSRNYHQTETEDFMKKMNKQRLVPSKLSEAETAIKQKLKPILDKAQEISEAYQKLQNQNKNSLRHKLSEATTEKVEVNADILGDMILHDLLEDTVMEMQAIESDEEVDEEAVSLQDAPTLADIYRRLDQMDMEQNEIRRRWGCVTFTDPSSNQIISSKNLDAPYSETPGTPPPLHVSSTLDASSSLPTQLSRSPVTDAQEAAIMFTKPAPQPKFTKHSLGLSGPGSFYKDWASDAPSNKGHSNPLPLYLNQGMVADIMENRSKFEAYLKKNSNLITGKFNPWGLVEEIADEIFSDCLSDIGQELGSVADEIVTHVYKSEFASPITAQEPAELHDTQSVSLTEPTTVTNDDN